MDQLASQFDEFVRARTPALLRSAYLLTGDQHLAEDLVQTALARTHRAWRSLHREGNAEAYTRKIMYNQQVSIWRRRKAAESLPGDLPEVQDPTDDHAQRTANRLAVKAALMRLTAKQRAVIVLRFFEDRPEAEIAELLGISIGTVKSQIFNALARLRAVAPELADNYEQSGVTR